MIMIKFRFELHPGILLKCLIHIVSHRKSLPGTYPMLFGVRLSAREATFTEAGSTCLKISNNLTMVFPEIVRHEV